MTGRNGEGEEIPLTSFGGSSWAGILIQPGATGLDMPPVGIFSDESPNLDGSIFRSARTLAREVMIPVYLYGIDRPTVNGLKRRLFQALNPKQGQSVLSFTEGDGTCRRLHAYYKGGMEGSEGTDSAGFSWAKYGLSFAAMDPYFYPARSESIKWIFGAGEPFLSRSKRFFPMQLSNGVLGGSEPLPVNNPGDVAGWPIWSLSGPIKSFTLTSPTGETIKASPPSNGSDLVPFGRTLTIDTRPGRKTVVTDLGVNYWSRLDVNPVFWAIEPGDTSAKISVVAGSGKATVTLSFDPRYASYV
ncbi:phage tail family protein [Streptomyces sp. NPDC087850]|uniref:phage tail family protein n=1 Tax=Streptomyces sp. NPDC087850 TaxID=3365809 RepID=UPI003812FC0B